jgi:bifunctional non-homologous end joining protein LigD
MRASRLPARNGCMRSSSTDIASNLHVHAETISVFTRRGYDWTSRFAKIAADAWYLNARSAIIDSEVIAPGTHGRSDFASLQKELRSKRPSQKLVLYAFDLLYINGYDLRREPLVERKIRLQRLIANSPILYSEHFEVDVAEFYNRACTMGLEGIVSKQRDARYQSDRTDTWRKVTCRRRETLRICRLRDEGWPFRRFVSRPGRGG